MNFRKAHASSGKTYCLKITTANVPDTTQNSAQ
jgi:hypothetical protein